MMGYWGVGGMGFGWLSMGLFWLVVLAGLVFAIKWFSDQSSPAAAGAGPRGKSAMEILQERYARGDIQRDEYEQKKKDLTA